MVENKISQESAEEQFNYMLEYFDLEFADIEIEDGQEAAATMKNYLIRSIRRGRLEVCSDDGDFKVIHRLDNPTENIGEIVFTDKFARAKIAMRKSKDNKINMFMSALSGVPVSEFANLKGADVTTFDRLATVFSMV